MSRPTKEITDVFKDVPIASSLSGLWSLFVNSSGQPQKASLLKEINTGAAIADTQGVWLVIIYSKSSPSKIAVNMVVRTSLEVSLHIIYKKNLEVIFNQYGTVAVSSESNITDAVYVALRLSMGSV